MKILVYHAGALGDFISTVPVFVYIHDHFPGSSVTLLGNPKFARLLSHSGLIDTIWDIADAQWSALFLPEAANHLAFAGKIAGFDMAILFAQPDSAAIDNVRKVVPRVLHQAPFPDKKIPVARYHLSLFGASAALPEDWARDLIPDPSFSQEARQLLPTMDRYAALHPGSGSGRKNWPLSCFSRLAANLKAAGIVPVWILGEAEAGIAPDSAYAVLRNVPLHILTHVMRNSAAYIGNDSGISHLAAAVGTRCVILFGASDPDVWKPWGKNVSIICRGQSCSPCHPSKGPAPDCAGECMTSIQVDEVFAQCMHYLQ